MNLLPSSGEGLLLERQFLFLCFYYVSSFSVTGIRTCELFHLSVLWITSPKPNLYTTRGSRIIVNFYSTYVSRHNLFLFISGLFIGSHIGLMSMLGWLITWSVQWMNAESLSFLILEFSSLLIMLALSH